jgi:hypothetical protein
MDSENFIFVSIASYRDPQLIPTIEDCRKKASRPDRLRFGICWQHDPDEAPPGKDGQFRVLDIPWRESRGACWARAQVMGLWQGEPWFLQVDSHCRFAHRWDDKLLRIAHETNSPKPILSTYANPFTAGANEVLAGGPLQMAFQGFTPEGIPHMRPLAIRNWHSLRRPMRARFLSAGFLFAPGTLVREVPYDPELYFLGEEAAMTLRAFTHGYDLFHPQEAIVWHDYVRKDAVKHWDDHTVAWGEQDLESRRKVRMLLTGEPVDSFGLGSARTLMEYEEYAGLSFRLRKAQDYTSRSEEPPNPTLGPGWAEEIYTWMVRIRLQADLFPPGAWQDYSFWYIGVHDEQGFEIHRRDLTPAEIAPLAEVRPEIVLILEMQSGCIPASWTVWPVNRSGEWLGKLTGKLEDGEYAIVREETE